MVTERDQTILTLYGQGAMMKDIAAAVGMAANSIVSVLRRHGIDRPNKPQKRWRGKPEIKDSVAKLWAEGLCASQIAERLQEGRVTVDKCLSDLGIRDCDHPRHRYDGIGSIGKAYHRSRKSGAI